MQAQRTLSIDWLTLILVFCLSGLGLVMLYSASAIVAEERFGDPLYFFLPQVRNMILGIVLMLIVSQINYNFWVRLAYPILFVSIIMLILVLIPGIGYEVGGATRWLRLPGFSFQPSEAAKLAIVVYLAYSLSRKNEISDSFWYALVPHLGVTGCLMGLIVLEPDLGTALCVGVIAISIMFVAGTKIWHLILLGLAGAWLVYYQIYSYGFRMRRMTAFLDPWQDPSGAGYHIIHSFYAFASGGLWGQGPGGSQQKLFFLPEAHTDFIFSVMAEEVGLGGVFLVAILFLILIRHGLKISRSARDLPGVYLALGCTLLIGIPAFFNMAVVTALLPTKGLPLPFFSYGGTNLMISFVAIGILLNISSRSSDQRLEQEYNSFREHHRAFREKVKKVAQGAA